MSSLTAKLICLAIGHDWRIVRHVGIRSNFICARCGAGRRRSPIDA